MPSRVKILNYMEIKARFDHYNINVFDLEKSIQFYDKALGLKEVRRKEASDGSFILVFLGDGVTGFTLELTWLRDWDRPYNMGDNEQHLCLRVEGDYDEVRAYHKEMGARSEERRVGKESRNPKQGERNKI